MGLPERRVGLAARLVGAQSRQHDLRAARLPAQPGRFALRGRVTGITRWKIAACSSRRSRSAARRGSATPAGSYRPGFTVGLNGLFGSLFIRANTGSYYFGNYYGIGYRGLGYTPWTSYGPARLRPAPELLQLGRNRGTQGWNGNLAGLYTGRLKRFAAGARQHLRSAVAGESERKMRR